MIVKIDVYKFSLNTYLVVH